MNVKIDEQFGISTDENIFILYEVKTKGKESKDFGAEYESTIGYFGTLPKALEGYLKHSLRKNSNGVKTTIDLLARLEDLNACINNMNKQGKK